MKGLVLAGGTATRLFPLTLVTNKHLLPIYDRPMIYYPIETLAGMGIREVMVVVGGKSVGDVVELLADGAHFGLDLTYRYQRGALGIAHAIGLARNFVGSEAFCVVLGDNILRGAELADIAREFERGEYDAGTLLYRVPDPERFGVAELDAGGNVIGFEEKPKQPKSNLIPIGVYFLRPDAFDVIDHLAPSGRGEFEITDVLNYYIPGRRLFTRVYDGHWTDAGTVPSLLRAAEMAEADAGAGKLQPPRSRPSDRRADDQPAGAVELGADNDAWRQRSGHVGVRPALTREIHTTPVDRLPPSPHLLVTGGAGFIGSAFVRDVLARGDGTRITVLDKLTYAGNRGNLASAESDPSQAARLRFVQGDIADADVAGPLVDEVDAVVNFAAESHVDRSILDPEAFLRTGVIGVHVLLEAVRRQTRPVRFLQVSTDEVYGSVPEGHSDEGDSLDPRSPYSAAKAAGELLVNSYFVTFGLDVVTTRGSNTYGPFQHPEKLIPLFISNALDDQPLPMYGDGMQRRDWLYVSDHAGAVDHVLHHGASGDTYNVPGAAELPNRDVIAALLRHVGKPWSLVRTVEDRPGHDRRYAMNGARIQALGWQNRVGFDEGIASTVEWFRANEAWWRAVKAGDWDAYYERQYGARLAGGTATEGAVAPAAAVAGGPGSEPGPG